MFGKKKNKEVEKKGEDQSYWAYVSRQFKKNKRALYSFYVVLFLAIIAVFADFIANEKPLICSYKGTTYFPVLKEYAIDMGLSQWPQAFQNKDWKSEIDFDYAIFPPVPYLPKNLDYKCNFCSPIGEQDVSSRQWRHWLGTDDIGRDVLSGMIHGTRIAFMVGIVAMGIAFFIGLIAGGLSGFFGDTEMKVSRIRVVLTLIGTFFGFFYGFLTRSYIITDAFSESFGGMAWEMLKGIVIFVGIVGLFNLLAHPLRKIAFLGKKITIPVDIIITRIIEVVNSVPPLVLILAVVAVTKPSIFNVMAVIGLIRWTGIARFIRAELLRIRGLEYVEAATALGFSRMRTLFKHAIPNALSPVFIALAFGIASAILLESFLSFLGVGVPPEVITWGKLLATARTAPAAWWMAIFPGFAIFITVTLFNLIGEGLTDALDPRLKQ